MFYHVLLLLPQIPLDPPLPTHPTLSSFLNKQTKAPIQQQKVVYIFKKKM